MLIQSEKPAASREPASLQRGQSKPRLFIIGGDAASRSLTERLGRETGFHCFQAADGQQALHLISRHGTADCYVLDSSLPDIGHDLIKQIQEADTHPVIIIQTAESHPEEIVATMKLNVFDYLIKPLNPDQLKTTLISGWQHRNDLLARKRLEQQSSTKLRTHLQWLTYKEQNKAEHAHSYERNLIHNLMTSMNQGAGFGSILTMIDLLRLKSRKSDENQFIVPADLLSRLFQMSDVSRNLLNGLESIIEVIERQFNLMPTQLLAVQEHFNHLFKGLSEKITIRQEVKFHSNPESVSLEVDLNSVGLALEEMLINALKYTPDGGRIDCYTHQANGYAVLSVMNHVAEAGRIPRDFERLVIEPFIRLHPPVEGMEQVERFGLGLGLSVVNHIANKHGGMFLIQEVRDHMDGASRQRILAELFLPLADK